jgi:lysozyme family protein
VRENFRPSLAAVLIHEGGYVNDPQDPGGATNRGITQHVYDDWRRSQGLDPRSVRSLEQSEIEAIYRKLYWNACRCDDLPSGVDYCVFDFAVNSGASRAARYLQRAVEVAEDGQIGPMTIAAANKEPVCETIAAINSARLFFLSQLPTFARFGKGWTTRVGEVGVKAAEMAA